MLELKSFETLPSKGTGIVFFVEKLFDDMQVIAPRTEIDHREK